MPKVLLVGHVCCPDLGSEPGVTWRWASHLAKHNQVWVICHPQYREPTEAYLAKHPVANLHFHYVDLPAWCNPWNPQKGPSGLRLHYLLWQHAALRAARRLHARENFDVAHQVSWTTVTAATPLWKLPIPALWGPVGGAITTPTAFLKYFGDHQWSERLRTLRVKILPYLPGIRRAARHLTVCFATNVETMEFLRFAGARDIRYLTDQGLLEDQFREPSAPRQNDRLELFWAGRLEHRKALPIIIEALSLLPRDFRVRVTVAGEGPLEAEWKALAQQMNVADKVDFIGFINGDQMSARIDACDALIFCSLRDAFGTVVTEAMTRGRPVVALNHQGFGEAVPAEAILKVPVTTPEQTVQAYAEAILKIADPAVRARLSLGARNYIAQLGWLRRAEEMTDCYRRLAAARQPAALGSQLPARVEDA